MARLAGLLLLLMFLVGCGPVWIQADPLLDSELAANPGPAREILVTLPLAGRGANPPGASRHQYRSGQAWEVSLGTRAQVMALGQRFGLLEVDAWPIHALSVYCVRFQVGKNVSLPALLNDIAGLDYVTHAQPLNVFQTLSDRRGYNDPYLDLQYGPQAQAVQALHRHTRGARVRIGIVDTGVDASHPELRDRLVAEHDLLPARPRNDLIHGTAVAGIIGAAADNGEGIVGLAPDALLHVYRACASEGGRQAFCTSFALARALDLALEEQVEVLNLSLAGPPDPLLGELLRVAIERKVLVIAATDTHNPANSFPASHPGVIAALPPDSRADRNETGEMSPVVSLLHREDWLSTRAGGGYQFFRGASMSSAAMAGLSALVRAMLQEDHALILARQIARGDCPAAPLFGTDATFITALHHSLHCDSLAWRDTSAPLPREAGTGTGVKAAHP